MVLRFGHTTTINIYAVSLVICSVEKDGSPLSDEKKTIQTSLFALLKDFLKSPTQEELLSFLAFILTLCMVFQVQAHFPKTKLPLVHLCQSGCAGARCVV